MGFLNRLLARGIVALALVTASFAGIAPAEAAGRFALPNVMESDENGVPGSGWQLEFFESGTSTPLDTYSDDALTTANANPVVADSNGRFGDIFLQGDDYKVVLKDENDVTIWTADPVRSATPKSSVVISKSTSYTVAAGDDGKLITADATSGAFTITLPAAATAGDGFEVSIIKIDSSSNAVTIDGDGSETINDETDIDLSSQFDAAVLRSDGSEWFATTIPVSTSTPLPRGYIDGLAASINGVDGDHDIDLAAGVARDGGDAANLTLTATLTKRIDAAWAVGDGAGGLDTGAVAADTTYYIWLIRRSDTGVTDALFSTSASSPTMPTNYDQKRLLGQLSTDGSSNIEYLFVREDESPGTTSVVSTASGSGATIDGFPSWVTRVTVMFESLSLDDTDDILIRIGDSGGIHNSGYVAESGMARNGETGDVRTSTAGFIVGAEAAANAVTGIMTLQLLDSANHIWVSAHAGRIRTTRTIAGGGSVTLDTALTRIQVLDTAGDAFDGGQFSVMYE